MEEMIPVLTPDKVDLSGVSSKGSYDDGCGTSVPLHQVLPRRIEMAGSGAHNWFETKEMADIRPTYYSTIIGNAVRDEGIGCGPFLWT